MSNKQLPVSNEYIISDIKAIVPIIFNRLKQTYKDIQFKVESELGTLYEEYLKYSYQKYSTVKTLLYKNEGKYLYDFYEHIVLKRDFIEEISTDNSNNIFKDSNNIIVTGTGGIGKSMLVKHIFVDQIQQATSVPIFVELKSINDVSDDSFDFENFLYEEVKNHHLDLEKIYFIETLKSGKYTIIFDGLDEVASGKRYKVDAAIKRFVDLYNENKYILSSRPAEDFIGWSNFIEYEMAPLSKKQALSLVNKLEYDKKVKRNFYNELQNTLYDKHESFASIPLLLTIMLLTYEAGASIPNNLTDFYQQAFYTLYQRHDASKSGYKRELQAKLSPEDFMSVLSYIALKTFFNSQVDFNSLFLNEILDKYKEKNNFSFLNNSFIVDATQNACMMIQEGNDIKFAHRSFQEYFAAVGINKIDDSRQNKILYTWIKSDINNIIAHRAFIEALFTIQTERTYSNLCVSVIEEFEGIISDLGDTESIIKNVFIHFLNRNGENISFVLKTKYRTYFDLQFDIFRSLKLELDSIDLPDKYVITDILRGILVKSDKKYYYDNLNDNEKEYLKKWIESWFIARHNFLVNWKNDFVEQTKTRKRNYQSIIDEI